MKSLIALALISALLVTWAEAAISNSCIQCIGKVEGGSSGCNWDVGSYSCGKYQIKENYWIDCGRPLGDWKKCGASNSCSENCIRSYMNRYEAGCKRALGKSALSCHDYGRLHNGGPSGCSKSSTNSYVQAMQSKC